MEIMMVINSYAELIELIDKKGRVVTTTSLEEDSFGVKSISDTEISESGIVTIGGCKVFAEVLNAAPTLIICGAGHVGMNVCMLGSKLGFDVDVVDDRKVFLTKERFPDARRLILCDNFDDDFWNEIPDGGNSYYVMCSRSHDTDGSCIRHTLRRKGIYKGMLGSGKKLRGIKERLFAEGFTEEDFKVLHTPIGLPLGGQTPMEVALSIMAEIVQVRHREELLTIEPDICDAIRNNKGMKAVMLTIVSTSGSSARKTGSKMLVLPDARIFGSIGGGVVEYMATKHAATVEAAEIREYDLSEDMDGVQGMYGAGRIRVLFEPIEL